MKKLIPYLYFFFLIIFISHLYSFSIGRNDKKIIKEVKVEFKGVKNYFLTHEMVSNELVQDGRVVLNRVKSEVDLFDLENLLSRNPYVEETEISVTPEGILNALIKQRVPIARILGSNGNYYIDESLVEMPISLNFSARVPLVQGVDGDVDINKVQKLLSYVKNDDFLKKEVVAVKKRNNDFILLVRSGSHIVNFGDVCDVSLKFKNLKAFYSKALFDETVGKYKEINIKYRNQVVCVKK